MRRRACTGQGSGSVQSAQADAQAARINPSQGSGDTHQALDEGHEVQADATDQLQHGVIAVAGDVCGVLNGRPHLEVDLGGRGGGGAAKTTRSQP